MHEVDVPLLSLQKLVEMNTSNKQVTAAIHAIFRLLGSTSQPVHFHLN
jgi:hypothetical protein